MSPLVIFFPLKLARSMGMICVLHCFRALWYRIRCW